MSCRTALYWTICTALAALVASAEPVTIAAIPPWAGGSPDALASLQPVGVSGRSMFLFAGIIAMAFTYRRAWMNWKKGPKS